jgi:hypothetical protein
VLVGSLSVLVKVLFCKLSQYVVEGKKELGKNAERALYRLLNSREGISQHYEAG